MYIGFKTKYRCCSMSNIRLYYVFYILLFIFLVKYFIISYMESYCVSKYSFCFNVILLIKTAIFVSKRKFCMEQNHTRLLNIIYHIYGICGPLFMLFILILAHKSNMTIFKNTNPRIGDGLCWFPSMNLCLFSFQKYFTYSFSDFKLTLMYFYGPVSVLLISNIFFYIWTIVYICNQRMFDTNDKKAKVFRFK